MGVSQNSGYFLGGPWDKDDNILGSILGSPYLGNLPYVIYGLAKKKIAAILLRRDVETWQVHAPRVNTNSKP